MNGEIVIFGLPCEGLQALAGGLGIPHVEDDEIRAAHDAPDEQRDFTPEQLLEVISGRATEHGATRVLLVYQKPWRFLERQLKQSAHPPGIPAQIEWFSGNALAFWHAYHAALFGLHRQLAGNAMLLNGDRSIDLDMVAELIGSRPSGQPAAAPPRPGPAPGNEEAYWQAVNRAAPDCLELYGTLESCAELFGRPPEFGFGRFPPRDGRLADLLRAELKAVSLREKAELYLHQLAQVQAELKHQVESGRQKDLQIAELQRSPILHMVRGFRQSAVRLISSLPGGGWVGQATRQRSIKKQATTIRASGLFDEKWYLEAYPDVAQSGRDPVEHYLRFGTAEGRNPSAQFSTRWYLDAYSDVSNAGMNPLLHYIESGRHEGRRPAKTNRPPARR